MVAAILVIGFASGMIAALLSVLFLNASIAVAIFAYIAFGMIGTCFALLALASRSMESDSDVEPPRFDSRTVPVTHR